jgi:APA family basic amino acid/polyamine antiporter
MLVVGGVIGSGIFKKPGVMAAQLGSPEMLLGVWILAGIITLMGALTNAEIAGMIPETGGQYVFMDRIYGPFWGFLYGWAVFAVIQTGSIAALAYVFAEYSTKLWHLPEFGPELSNWAVSLPFIGQITPLKDIGIKVLAVVLIFGLTVVNYLGVRLGGRVQNVFTVAKVSGMAALCIGAFFFAQGGQFQNLTQSSAVIHPSGMALLAAIAAALQGAFWAYDGWNKITYIAGEVHDPQRNVPRSLFIGMLAVMAIYVTMDVAYSYVLPVDVMAKSKLVAADVAERCFAGGSKWIAVVVMISTFGANNATILASARVYFSMARRGVFPSVLGNVHPRFHTPGPALVAQGIWSAALVFTGTFDTLTDALIFVSWVTYGVSAWGVFVLRKREPNTPRPYRVPGYPWVPMIFVVFSAVFLILTIQYDLTAYQQAHAAGKPAIINFAFGSVLVLAGAPIYLFYHRKIKGEAGAVKKEGGA